MVHLCVHACALIQGFFRLLSFQKFMTTIEPAFRQRKGGGIELRCDLSRSIKTFLELSDVRPQLICHVKYNMFK